MRISKDEYYLEIARAVSKRSTCLKRHYGAVIVKNDEIIATGYNGSPRGEDNCCDVYEVCPRQHVEHNSGDYRGCPAVHAEQNALISASRQETQGATLYLSGEEVLGIENGKMITERLKDVSPCPICARMIQNSGIERIVGNEKT